MATELLVTHYVKHGEELLKQLDSNGVPINAAFWYKSSEEGRWKLILATRLFDDAGPREAYQRVNDVLRAGDFGISLQDVSVVSAHDTLIRLLLMMLQTGPTDVAGIHFTGNTINHIFIEDAYIYRLS